MCLLLAKKLYTDSTVEVTASKRCPTSYYINQQDLDEDVFYHKYLLAVKLPNDQEVYHTILLLEPDDLNSSDPFAPGEAFKKEKERKRALKATGTKSFW